MICQKCNNTRIIAEHGKVPMICLDCFDKVSTPVILFRKSYETEEEFDACKRICPCVIEYRSQIPKKSLVIPRYSALPYYKELEVDIRNHRSKLINSYTQHLYVANIENYIQDIQEYTPQTWFNWINLPAEKSFVLKGRTNSRKHQWSSQMFAQTRNDIPKIAANLLQDTFMRDQGLCVREYVPLKNFTTGINGLPISNEWRIFMLQDQIIDYGFYWSDHEDYKPYDSLPKEAEQLINTVSSIIKNKINFYVIDIAETQEGNWIVIELNDASMSGLSMIKPERFYKNLLNSLTDYVL